MLPGRAETPPRADLTPESKVPMARMNGIRFQEGMWPDIFLGQYSSEALPEAVLAP